MPYTVLGTHAGTGIPAIVAVVHVAIAVSTTPTQHQLGYFYAPAAAERDNQRRDLRIGADDIDAVEFGGRSNALGVDGEMAVSFGFEEAAEAFVADQRFVALAQRLFQSGQGRGARGGIVARFSLIAFVEIAFISILARA